MLMITFSSFIALIFFSISAFCSPVLNASLDSVDDTALLKKTVLTLPHYTAHIKANKWQELGSNFSADLDSIEELLIHLEKPENVHLKKLPEFPRFERVIFDFFQAMQDASKHYLNDVDLQRKYSTLIATEPDLPSYVVTLQHNAEALASSPSIKNKGNN